MLPISLQRFCPLFLLSLVCCCVSSLLWGRAVLGTAGAALTTPVPAQEMETFLHVLQEKL